MAALEPPTQGTYVVYLDIVVKYVHTNANPSDVLTKSLNSQMHNKHVVALMGEAHKKRSDITRAKPVRKMRQRTFDIESAYLKGKFDGEHVYARPPPGKARRFVHGIRGIPIVWKLLVPLYGEADAGVYGTAPL